MWHRTCPLLIGVLSAGLVLTRRRLRDAEVELERLRAEPVRAPSAESRLSEPTAGSDGAVRSDGRQAAKVGPDGSDLSSEWEQAVPPMDS